MWCRGRCCAVGDGVRRGLAGDPCTRPRVRGSALVIVLLALLLLSALGAAMVALSTADTLAASNQRDARAVLYAAESAIEQAADEVVRMEDWDAVLSGALRSARADGPPSGPRTLPDGVIVNLDELPHLASCGRPTPCTAALLGAVTGDRLWGSNNPHWRLFYSGPSGGPHPALPVYAIVLVGDDPTETDGDPARDAPPGSPGDGILLLRASAFGPSGSRRTVQATVERAVASNGAVAPRFLQWLTVG